MTNLRCYTRQNSFPFNTNWIRFRLTRFRTSDQLPRLVLLSPSWSKFQILPISINYLRRNHQPNERTTGKEGIFTDTDSQRTPASSGGGEGPKREHFALFCSLLLLRRRWGFLAVVVFLLLHHNYDDHRTRTEPAAGDRVNRSRQAQRRRRRIP